MPTKHVIRTRNQKKYLRGGAADAARGGAAGHSDGGGAQNGRRRDHGPGQRGRGDGGGGEEELHLPPDESTEKKSCRRDPL
jgi:hypothetical protein